MEKITCSVCGNVFEMTEQEIDYYRKKGYEMPKRCSVCRKQGKLAKKPHVKKGTRYIRQSTSFSVSYFGFILVPKYAVYGRWDNSYFYVDDFEQFLTKKESYKIHIIKGSDNNIKIKNMSVKNPIMRSIIEFVQKNDLYKVKCSPVIPRRDIEVVAKDTGNKRYGKYSDVKKTYAEHGWFIRE